MDNVAPEKGCTVRTNHWIVCVGLNVVSQLLDCYPSACEKAEQHILDGDTFVSIQHVGATSREDDDAERQMLRDPLYRLGDPTTHPDDRFGF